MGEFWGDIKIVDKTCNFSVDFTRIGLDNLPMYVLGQSDDCVLWSIPCRGLAAKRKVNNKKWR